MGCTLIPITDKGTPAAFYPFFSAFQNGIQNEQGNGGCRWGFGNAMPGGNNFGGNAQYGTLLFSNYLIFGGGGRFRTITNNFRGIMSNPCPAGGNQN